MAQVLVSTLPVHVPMRMATSRLVLSYGPLLGNESKATLPKDLSRGWCVFNCLRTFETSRQRSRSRAVPNPRPGSRSETLALRAWNELANNARSASCQYAPANVGPCLRYDMPANVGPVPQVRYARERGARASGTICPRTWGPCLRYDMPANVGPVPQVRYARERGARASGTICPRTWGPCLGYHMPANLGPVPRVPHARERGARASGRNCPRKWVVVSWLG